MDQQMATDVREEMIGHPEFARGWSLPLRRHTAGSGPALMQPRQRASAPTLIPELPDDLSGIIRQMITDLAKQVDAAVSLRVARDLESRLAALEKQTAEISTTLARVLAVTPSLASDTSDHSHLMISDLGWSPEEAAETYYRLRAFAEDWDAPGMDAYDAL